MFREIHDTKLILAQGSRHYRHYLVMSHINDSSFFDWNDDAREALKVGDGRIEVPQLDPMATEHIDASSAPFQEFIENRNKVTSHV
jgi:hypothetical protein